jgi:hypothetical protein
MTGQRARREIAAECLKGRPVRDVNGEPVGRIADICVHDVNGVLAVKHYWVAPASAATRLAAENVGWHLLRLLGVGRDAAGCLVPWDKLDLSDLNDLRTTCARSDLERAD